MSFLKNAAAARLRPGTLCALISTALLASISIDAVAAPVISGAPAATVTAAHYYTFQPRASDGGRKLTFSIGNKPSWAQFDSSTGRLYGTPLPLVNAGTYANIVISASDGNSQSSLAPFSVTVLALPNIAPIIQGNAATTAASGHAYLFQPAATDPDGLTLEFGIWNKPAWASFDSTTGRLSGTPTAADSGTYSNIIITAYDGYHKASLAAFTLVVKAAAVSGAGPTTTGTDNFPRLGLLSTGGPQLYGSSFQAFAAKFHMVVIGGAFEGWEQDVRYSKENVVQGIKSQSAVNTRVFQYVELNSLYSSTYAGDNGFPTLYNQASARKWWLYPTTTAGAPVADPQSSQRWLLNIGPAVPVDPSTGLGPYEWAAKYVDDLFHLGRYSGTSAAPSLDGFFLDNVLIDPSCGEGNLANGDWSRTGTTQAHNAASTYSAVMTGERSFYTYLAGAWPGSLQLGNAGTTFGIAVAGYYNSTDAALTSQIAAGTSTLSAVMDGGDLEHAIGKTYSIEYYGGALALQQWYRTAMANYGGSKLMLFSQGSVKANGSDPLTFNSAAEPATYSPAWQGARYGITAALMNNGYYFADVGVYDEETTANRLWFDEYDNAGAGVGYLGQPISGSAGNPQTSAWTSGVWKREFANGVVLWNPKGNGSRTVNVAALVSPSGRTGLKHINGKQNPTVNNGQAVTAVTLQDRDGVILLWSAP